MDTKPNRIPQTYGYTVCVIAVVTFLICTSVVVNNLFDFVNPIAASSGMESTYEIWRANYRPPASAPGVQPQRDTTSEVTLRRRYEDLRQQRILRMRFEASKALVTSGLLLVISVVLFVLHWRWMKRLGAAPEAGGA